MPTKAHTTPSAKRDAPAAAVTDAARPEAPQSPPDVATYAPTAKDVFELSAHLGASTVADVRLLTEAYTDAELVEIGNDFATTRLTSDALRILGVATEFFEKAPAADVGAVDLSAEVVRIGAWAAAEDARTDEVLRSTKASAKALAAGDVAKAEATLEQARNEKKKFSETLRSVGQRTATEAVITHAFAPAAHGEASRGPDVSLVILAKEGLALLASTEANIQRRAAFYRLTATRVAAVEKLAKEAKSAAKVLAAPKVIATQEQVDWWDGATYVILQMIVRAFQAARATAPKVPSVDFVSLKRRPGATKDDGKTPPDAPAKKPQGTP